MERIYVYDENGYTGRYYGLDSDMERNTALNQALDRMVLSEIPILEAYYTGAWFDELYPVFSADAPEGRERGYATLPNAKGERFIVWELRDDETSPEA